MENIAPVSDLRNYNQTLQSVADGQYVVLTKNGRPKYVVADYEEFEKMHATIELFTELQKGVRSFDEEAPLSLEQLKANMKAKSYE